MSKKALILVGMLGLAACDDNGVPLPVGPQPVITGAQVMPNPFMSVAAFVRVTGTFDSARVRFQVAGSGADSASPALAYSGGQLDLPVLGLLPSTDYQFRAVAYLGTDSVSSASLPLTTGPLPANLPAYTAGGTSPLPGFFVFSAGTYGLIIDHTGRVVWYREFLPAGPGLNFMAQPTGSFVGRVVTPDATDDDPMVELDITGAQVRELRCLGGRKLRFHDLILATDGSYWMMCDDTRVMDLSAGGGSATANVTATTVQHISAANALLFEWNAFDHFAMTDVDSATRSGQNVNFTHGNAIDLDSDGHLLISFRSLNEITKVNTTSGAVIWRMGGLRNQFTFSGPGTPGFSRQHNVRVAGPSTIILLDNVGSADSRYERYAVSTTAMTATLEQFYSSSVQTLIGGSVQQSVDGRFLVSFGTEGRVEEFDPAGNLLWRINGNPGYVFRAQRIASLYSPVPTQTR